MVSDPPSEATAMEPHVSTSQVEGERKERKKIQFAAMEPHESSQVDGERKERKKIQFADMDLNESSQDEGEQKERKKIQFAVQASAPPNLDPRQVEMIRRRRPTPATLFRVADQGSPEDDQSTHQWVVGENGVLKPKRVNPHVYQPPSLRDHQETAATDASEKVSCMPETARQIEAGDDKGDEEEDEDETEKTKEDEKRRGNN